MAIFIPGQPERGCDQASVKIHHDCFTVNVQLGIAVNDFDCHLQRPAATAANVAGVPWHARKDTRAPSILRTE